MTLWQKHVVFFALPIAVATTLMLAAPTHNTPDWLIQVSAACVVVAIAYAYLAIDIWAKKERAYSRLALSLIVIGTVAFMAGITSRQPVLAACGGLINAGVGVYLTGLLARWSDRLKQRK
jgi:xanthine/uracil permease